MLNFYWNLNSKVIISNYRKLLMWLEIIVGLIVGIFAYAIKKILFFKNGSSNPSDVPGMLATSKEMGNLEDIGKYGSLHKFLLHLHHTYGEIASFWFGTQLVVSITAPDMFKEQQKIFDRPHILFKLFEPFIGPKSLQYANKEDGKNRRIEGKCMTEQCLTKLS